MILTNNFSSLQQYYAEWLAALGFSSSVIYYYPKIVFYFLHYLNEKGINNIQHITQKNISDYHRYLQHRKSKKKDKTLGTAHLNKSFDAIDKFIECLHQHQANISITPTNNRILQDKNEWMGNVKVIRQEEIKILYDSVEKTFIHLSFAVAEPRRALTTLLLDLCYGCGLRRSEAYHLLISDIDLDQKILFVRQGKGYKDRYVPMSACICARIKIYIYQHRKSLKKNNNKLIPLTKEGMYKYFKTLLRASNINKEITLHTLRHSIATHLLQNGMRVEQISKFLGHSSLDSTQVYTHLLNE